MLQMDVDFSTLIGSFGVSLLLLAYFLNLFGYLEQRKLAYVLLNLIGSGLSCLASWLIHYIPFVVLEGLWFLVGLSALVSSLLKKKSSSTTG